MSGGNWSVYGSSRTSRREKKAAKFELPTAKIEASNVFREKL